ncbi:MAG TPA: hypothetical protein VHA82_13425 [Ramlibacter sp.]|uniref:hypothetical protein n=1 Tax=Ramlibacter sp. TaxID=1917967 RepID=UPI002C8F159A|nr:hypothetical protein [Ramlibacter sp.]HVZ44805.1 hypothetical protein [Ramlibacter sp.]
MFAAAPLVALTAYYNPFRGARRLRNYHVFRKNLGDVPLVAVEWSPDGRFDLRPDDADVLIRVQGGDLMWQKERLLNRGLARIRAEGLARDVAIIDADVVFAEADWVRRILTALETRPLIQCHRQVDYMPDIAREIRERDALARVEPERSLPSLAYALGHGEPLFTSDPERMRAFAFHGTTAPSSGNAGIAIAVRLTDLPRFELYDANIVGGADLLLATSYIGRTQEFFEPRGYSLAHRADAAAWAARCLPPPPRPPIGWADNRALHLWHGPLEDRQYAQRLRILGPRNYDPARDIDRSGEALRFRDTAAELKAAVGQYLASRHDA